MKQKRKLYCINTHFKDPKANQNMFIKVKTVFGIHWAFLMNIRGVFVIFHFHSRSEMSGSCCLVKLEVIGIH